MTNTITSQTLGPTHKAAAAAATAAAPAAAATAAACECHKVSALSSGI